MDIGGNHTVYTVDSGGVFPLDSQPQHSSHPGDPLLLQQFLQQQQQHQQEEELLLLQQLAQQAQQQAQAQQHEQAPMHAPPPQQPARPIDLWALTEEELEWAWALKIRVEADDELQNLTDFEYVHQAIYARENTEIALQRVAGLQAFRQEYGIQDTPEQGVRMIEAFMNKHPGFLLSVDIDDAHGHFVMIYDYAKRRPHELKTDQDWSSHLGGMYYLSHAMQNNIHAAREGIVHICECEGMGWENFSYEVVRRNFSHLYENYPLKHKEISWLRTPMVGNILYSFMKPLLDPEAVKKFHLGCTFNGYEGRLDGIFLLPNAEVAKQNLLQKLLGYLMVRYQVEQNYKLPDLPLDGFEQDDNEEEDTELLEEDEDEDMDAD